MFLELAKIATATIDRYEKEYEMKALFQKLCAAGVLLLAAPIVAQSPAIWTGSWAASPMAATAGGVTIGDTGITFRNFIHLSIGGQAVRIRLSNEYGTKPLLVADVHLARSASEGAIVAGSDHPLTFGGARSVEIPAGTVAVSDPVAMPVPDFADLSVSLHLASPIDFALTYHESAISTNYESVGDQAAEIELHDSSKISNWYLLTAVDVDAGPMASAAVVLGASVVNGTHSTVDKNLRWPDDLARRLQAAPSTAKIGVLNEGIGGNRILHDNVGMGGLARLNRDVLGQSNAKILIFSMGTNDIGRMFFPNDRTEKGITTEQMEWATQQVVLRAHARGMQVLCATLNPYEGAAYYNAEGERMRQAFNEFIRSSRACDGVVDFDRATLDPIHPTRMLSKFDSGDHLHPNDAGYQAMADAFNMDLFLRR
jgi:lysophospholipase L1-like esterase